MKLLQVNTGVNTGSTGRIAEDIGKIMMSRGHESYIAYGRDSRPSDSELIRIGGRADMYLHGLKTVVFDRHGFGSARATRDFIRHVEHMAPDVIGMHNIHGYYLNIEEWFTYLASAGNPLFWTLHDCWSFTGHCTYFDDIDCKKWQTGCHSCPKLRKYPASYFADNSKSNYLDKSRLFNSVRDMEIIVPSQWLRDVVQKSFLSGRQVHVIHNGVNTRVFRPMDSDLKERLSLKGKRVVMGCANTWDKRKGLEDLVKMRNMLPDSIDIVAVGLSQEQIKALPAGIHGFSRTSGPEELAEYYNMADVFANPTYQDNFPTTNIEALACGTPVVTYRTGGSPEAVDAETGIVVDKGDLAGMGKAIQEVMSSGSLTRERCRKRAEIHFDQHKQFSRYAEIFEKTTS